MGIFSDLAFFVLLAGIPLAIFKRTRRIGILSFVGGFLLIAFVVVPAEDEAARDAGFQDSADRRAAEEAGYTNPKAWKIERKRLAAAEEEQVSQKRLAEEQEAAEERRKGFHCLSAWDGSHAEFKRDVRDMMRNPSSFEHIETRITPVDDEGEHRLLMSYRAENGFGGMTVGEAIAIVEQADCSYTVVSVE